MWLFPWPRIRGTFRTCSILQIITGLLQRPDTVVVRAIRQVLRNMENP